MSNSYHYRPDSLAYAWGGPAMRGYLRRTPADFKVNERLDFQPCGEGEHVWLYVEKVGCNTEWLVKNIARLAGVRKMDVGFAGLKDRHAQTRQWFSVYLPGKEDVDWLLLAQAADSSRGEKITVLQQTHHSRKLRRGQLGHNEFELLLSGLEGDRELMESRLADIKQTGVPNYFGEQRFGSQGDNVDQFLSALSKKTSRKRLKPMLISAARSFVFNALLSQRVIEKNWCSAIPGDLMMLSGSQSYFLCDEVDAEIERRIDSGDISPSGPLWGRGSLPGEASALQQEAELATRYPELCTALQDLGLQQERRNLRLIVSELRWQWIDDSLQLSFCLPKGGYATSVIRELMHY